MGGDSAYRSVSETQNPNLDAAFERQARVRSAARGMQRVVRERRGGVRRVVYGVRCAAHARRASRCCAARGVGARSSRFMGGSARHERVAQGSSTMELESP